MYEDSVNMLAKRGFTYHLDRKIIIGYCAKYEND